jgi:hypothetical protein
VPQKKLFIYSGHNFSLLQIIQTGFTLVINTHMLKLYANRILVSFLVFVNLPKSCFHHAFTQQIIGIILLRSCKFNSLFMCEGILDLLSLFTNYFIFQHVFCTRHLQMNLMVVALVLFSSNILSLLCIICHYLRRHVSLEPHYCPFAQGFCFV